MANQLDVRRLVRWLVAHGFEEKPSGKGGHRQFVHPDHGVKITVPGHVPSDITKKVAGMIRRQLDVSRSNVLDGEDEVRLTAMRQYVLERREELERPARFEVDPTGNHALQSLSAAFAARLNRHLTFLSHGVQFTVAVEPRPHAISLSEVDYSIQAVMTEGSQTVTNSVFLDGRQVSDVQNDAMFFRSAVLRLLTELFISRVSDGFRP